MLKALPTLFPHLGTAGGPRVEFYNKFQREADEYDRDFMKKYDGDLDTTLIFASAFLPRPNLFVMLMICLGVDRPGCFPQSHLLSLSMWGAGYSRITHN